MEKKTTSLAVCYFLILPVAVITKPFLPHARSSGDLYTSLVAEAALSASLEQFGYLYQNARKAEQNEVGS